MYLSVSRMICKRKVVDTPFVSIYVPPVMFGLKKFISRLSEVLDISELILIERQRALVEKGLLLKAPGHGPGSGVRYSAESVAILLTAVLATPNLLDTVAATRLLLSAKRSDDVKVEDTLGGAETFKEALVHVLTSDEPITVVRVYRRPCFAVFYLKDDRPNFVSKKKPSTSAFDDIAQIHIDPIRALMREAQAAAVTEEAKRKSPSKRRKVNK
jgi:hypothetical protein